MNWQDLLNKIDEKISLAVKETKKFLPGLYQDAGLSGGKRLRAKVFFALAQETSAKSLKIATAIELLHAATLIHDDILDNSKLRRGKPALYTKHGIAPSLLYGDYLFFTAFSLIAELDNTQIYKEITQALREVLTGEMIENYRRRDITLTKEEYLSVIEKKTGVLFGLAAKLAAMIRKPDKKMIKEFYQFGKFIGCAYQIIDDGWDYFGEHADKEKFKDIGEGLVTLPLILLLERCSQAEKKKIISLLNNGSPEKRSMLNLVSLMKAYEVPAKVSGETKAFTDKAKSALAPDLLKKFEDNFDIFSWLEAKLTIFTGGEQYAKG